LQLRPEPPHRRGLCVVFVEALSHLLDELLDGFLVFAVFKVMPSAS
jgi:hypothetical protein